MTAGVDAAAMPTIASRPVQPEARDRATLRPPRKSRRRTPRQPFDAPPAPPSPARELARRALDVLRRARLASPPARWQQPGFGREVDLVRLHLVPVRTRTALASSFGREAFNLAVDDDWPAREGAANVAATSAARSIGPVHVAYALRWLELGDGRARSAFPVWLADPAEPTLR